MIHYNVYGSLKDLDFLPRGVIQKITRTVVKLEHLKSNHIVSFIFVNDEEIHKINKEYRNIDRPTDVISFATIDGNPSRELSYELGDIYISLDRLKAQAVEYQHTLMREFAFLVTHGLLHLLGYDHIRKEDEIIMFSKQDEVLEQLKIYR